MPRTDCPPREEWIAYALGTLGADRRAAMADHLQTCPACQAELASVPAPDRPTVSGALFPAAGEACVQAEGANGQPVGGGAPVATTESGLPGDPRRAEEAPAEEFGQLGEYRLIAKLGRGGMGTVYAAVQTNLDRVVALKVLPPSRADDQRAIARFYREMKAIGRLTHPNIVHAFDAREIDGTPILAMEYVDGLDLSEVLRRVGPLGVADACELIRQAAVGLQYAHENGLVHRDLKPSNLMLAFSTDSRGKRSAERCTVKILDLGLALALTGQESGSEVTQEDMAIGTAEYMAPEQVIDSHHVDIRADIYALGCTLYKLLAGRAPFSGPDYPDNRAKMLAHAHAPVPPIQALRNDIPEELAALLARLLAKDPADRYATPGEVADALGPFCTGSNPLRLLCTAQDIDVSQLPDSESMIGTLKHRFAAEMSTEVKTAERAASAATTTEHIRRQWPLTVGLVLVLLVGLLVAWQIMIRITQREVVVQTPEGDTVHVGQDGTVKVTLAKRPPLSQAALVTNPAPIPGVRSWTVETRGHRGEVLTVAHSPDGKLMATGCEDGTIRVWAPATGQFVKALVGHDAAVGSVSWSADSRQLASGSQDNTVRTWDVPSGQQTQKIAVDNPAHQPVFVAFSPDGKTLAYGCGDARIHLWDVASGKPSGVVQGPEEGVRAIAWSADSQRLAVAGGDRKVRVCEASTGRVLQTFAGHAGPVTGVAVSPDNELVASSSTSSQPEDSVRVWEVATGQPHVKVPAQDRGNQCVTFSADGKTLIVGGAAGDGKLRAWNVETGELVYEQASADGAQRIASVAVSPDSQLLAVAHHDGTVELCDLRSGRSLRQLPRAKDKKLPVSPDGRLPDSPEIRREVVYIVETETAQATLAPEQFTERYAWKDEPQQVAQGQPKPPKSPGSSPQPIVPGPQQVAAQPTPTAPPARVATEASGVDNQLEFWGGSYVQTPVKYDGSHPITLEALVWVSERFTTGHHVFVNYSASGGFCLETLASGEWSFTAKRGGVFAQNKACEVVPGRHHIAVVYSGSKPSLFVDGRRQKLQDSNKRDYSVSDQPFGIGGIQPHLKNSFVGWIDEVRISRVARYDDDFTPKQRFEPDQDTLALYHFDEGQGDIAHDASGNGNDAKVLLARWVRVGEEYALAQVPPARRAEGAGAVADLSKLPPILVEPGEPLSDTALVSRPTPIAGLRSWSIESRGFRAHIGAIAASPDGRLVAVAGEQEPIIRLYDSDLRLHKVLVGQVRFAPKPNLAWSPDSRFLASGGGDGIALVWEVATGRLLRRYKHGNWTCSLAWSPGGQQLAIGTYGQALIVTPFGSETVQRNLPAKGNVERVAWSPDGSILAVSDEYGALGFWKTDQWALAREIADRTAVFGNVGAGASSGLGGWSPDARWLACSNGKMLRILDGKRFEVAREFPYPGIPSWSPSGTMLLSSLPLITADCDVTVLDPVSGEKRGKLSTRRGGAAWLPGKDAIIVSTARLLELYDSATLTRQGRAADLGGRAGVRAVISPDGSRVVSARDGKAMLWAAETGQLLRQMSNFSEVLGDWSPSGKWIAGRPSGKELVLVDPDDPSQRIALASGSVTDWSWSPDRNFGASSGRDKKVRIWDLTTGKQQHELDHVDELFGVAWSPDGKHLASVTKDSLQLWDATSYAAIRTIKPLPGGRDDRHTILSWSPDSQLLFLTVHASVVYAYDVAGGTVRPYWSITGAQHVDGGSFSPDGKKFAAVDTYVQRGWVLYRDTQETVKINSFARLRWLPDSRRLIGGDDGATNLYGYDTETNRKLGVLLPSMSDKQYVCIGPDGHYRGSPQIDDHIVYVALHEDGSQVTYAPKEFREKFGWKNDPDKARFLALDPPDSTPPSDRPLSAEVTIEPPKTPGGPRTPRFAPDPVTVKPGQPLSVRALVSQPAAIPGLRSWSLELAGGEGKWLSSLEYSPDGQRIAVTDARDVNNADAGVGLSPRIRLYDRQCRLRRVLLGHEAVVSDASWSPDGQYLASTGDDKTVRFWEAATGRLLRTLPLESPGVALRWSPDGKRLAVAGDRRACLIDVQTKRTDCFGPSRRWHSVGWSADGQRVAIGSNEGFQVWAAQTLALAFERKSPEGKLTHIAWSPDGRWIAGAHAEKTITLWETDREAQRTLSLPEHRPYRLAWSAKSDRLVSTGIDSWVMVWDVASGKPALQSCDRTRNDAAWSPDGQTFAIAPGGLLQVLDAGSGNVLNRQPAAGQIATRASGVLAPDGRTVQVRRGDALVLFDLEAGKVCDTWPNIPVGPRFASPSGDRIAILAGSGADSLQILDATQLQLKAWSAGHAKPARVAAWSPDGKRLATGSDDQIAVVWDAATGQPEKKLEHPCAVAAVAWSRDGQWLATGGADRQIRLWSTGDFTLGRTCGPLASGFSDDRRWPLMEWNRIDSLLAAALGDGSVVLVKPQSGEVSQPVLKFSQAAAAVEWSRDGSALLASSSPDMVGVWKVPERQAVYLDARLAGPNAFFARWLPDSRRILLGCQAAPFKQVYDVAAGRRLGLLVPTIGDDQWVIISPEGHYRGTRRIDEHLVYVALTEDGAQETYTPSAFRAKFGWKNDPDKAWLLGSPAPAAGAPATPPAGAAPPK